MKLMIREFVASLRERGELDAILPDLLSELGYTIISRPGRGTRQHGVDIAAVGQDDDGERKVFLFSVKQGNLTRQDWDGTPQALRSSLNEIQDAYIPSRIPKRYQNLPVVDIGERSSSVQKHHSVNKIVKDGLLPRLLVDLSRLLLQSHSLDLSPMFRGKQFSDQTCRTNSTQIL